MGRALRIGVHSPFFGSTYGGGEKYLGVAIEALRDAYPQHHVDLVTPVAVDAEKYREMLGLDLAGVGLRAGAGGGNPVLRQLNRLNSLRRVRNLALALQAMRQSRDYDLFISMVYVIPGVTRARRSVMLCQFPYPLSHGLRGRWLAGELRRFDTVICQSEFVREWIGRYWGRDSAVVNPPIDIPSEPPDLGAKENLILSVGRFFAAGHTKRQDLMVRQFRRLCDEGLQGWELHLAGGVHREGPNAGFYESVVALAGGYPIHFHPDAPGATVQDLYRRASIYWHAAGFGIDPQTRPIDVEHFGMTTAEAMGQGAVPVVVRLGGQVEVVRDSVDGFLWADEAELRRRTLELCSDAGLRARIADAAVHSSRRFGRPVFRARFLAEVSPLVEALEADATGAGVT